MNTFLVFQVAITVLSYGLLLLFVVIDGIRYSNDIRALFLYLPYAIACYAMVRTIQSAMRHKQLIHALLVFLGLFTFASLA